MLPSFPPDPRNPGVKVVRTLPATAPERGSAAARSRDAPRPPGRFWRGICLALMIALPFWLLVGLMLWYGLSGTDPGQGPAGPAAQ